MPLASTLLTRCVGNMLNPADNVDGARGEIAELRPRTLRLPFIYASSMDDEEDEGVGVRKKLALAELDRSSEIEGGIVIPR